MFESTLTADCHRAGAGCGGDGDNETPTFDDTVHILDKKDDGHIKFDDE